MKRNVSAIGLSVSLLLTTFGGVPTLAQTQPDKPQSADHPGTLQILPIKTGLFLITGGGANTLLRLSANGLIVVDGKYADDYASLHAKVKRADDQPVRALILTNVDPDHIGTNEEFLANGTHIVVNQDAGLPLTANNSPRPAGALPPIVTFDREYTLKMGGIEAQLMHYGRAHTGGDTVVYFPNLKVVAVGDLYATVPNPDYSNGGSLVGWGPVLAQVMTLDFDVAVPASGPPITRADLEAFQTRMGTLISRASELARNGVPKDQLMARLKTDDLGWHLDFTPNQIDGFYAELRH